MDLKTRECQTPDPPPPSKTGGFSEAHRMLRTLFGLSSHSEALRRPWVVTGSLYGPQKTLQTLLELSSSWIRRVRMGPKFCEFEYSLN